MCEGAHTSSSGDLCQTSRHQLVRSWVLFQYAGRHHSLWLHSCVNECTRDTTWVIADPQAAAGPRAASKQTPVCWKGAWPHIQ